MRKERERIRELERQTERERERIRELERQREIQRVREREREREFRFSLSREKVVSLFVAMSKQDGYRLLLLLYLQEKLRKRG